MKQKNRCWSHIVDDDLIVNNRNSWNFVSFDCFSGVCIQVYDVCHHFHWFLCICCTMTDGSLNPTEGVGHFWVLCHHGIWSRLFSHMTIASTTMQNWNCPCAPWQNTKIDAKPSSERHSQRLMWRKNTFITLSTRFPPSPYFTLCMEPIPLTQIRIFPFPPLALCMDHVPLTQVRYRRQETNTYVTCLSNDVTLEYADYWLSCPSCTYWVRKTIPLTKWCTHNIVRKGVVTSRSLYQWLVLRSSDEV